MLRGLYTATSAMHTSQKKLDVTSNNIANVNTTGFKKDAVVTQSFPETLLHKINGNLSATPFNRNLEVEVTRDAEAFRLSAEGGYFRAEGPHGLSYSSYTSFATDDEGYLRTFSRDVDGKVDASRGNYIVDTNDNRVLVEGNDFDINREGQVVSGGAVIANLVSRPGPNVIGTMNSGLRLDQVQTYFNQGAIEETGNPLNIAIEGKGFFRVNTPMGEMYTRGGNFSLSDNGEIVTKEGYFLTGQFGSIIMPENFEIENFSIAGDGAIIVNNEVIDQLEMANITNVNDLRKYKEGYYQILEGTEVETQEFEGKILQGYLEGSNINTIAEMADMITTLRLYESNQKVVQAYDEILQKAVNDIGRV